MRKHYKLGLIAILLLACLIGVPWLLLSILCDAGVPRPAMPTPNEMLAYDLPVIRLGMYSEGPDGQLSFSIHVMNPTLEAFDSTKVEVVLYDASDAALTHEVDECGPVDPFSECHVDVYFHASSVPNSYATYNIFAQAAAGGGEQLTAQLSDQPVSGSEGENIIEGRVLPVARTSLTWALPQEGYRPGQEVEAELEMSLDEGRLEEGVACVQIVELREYADGDSEYVTLGQQCQQVTLSTSPTRLPLTFEPSGFTWVTREGPGGTFKSLAIEGRGQVSYHQVLLAESIGSLHLPPIEVIDAWWEGDGERPVEYTPEETYSGYVRLRSLADDTPSHALKVSARYTEQDPEEWWFSGYLLFLPCFMGLCTDEVEMAAQQHDVVLAEGEEATYSVTVQPPLHPTGEIGTDGYMCLAVDLNGTTIWMGAIIEPVPDS